MNHYQVSLRLVREKVFIIKTIRLLTTWGLKECKDWVEDNFTFDSFMEDHATFNITITASQFGRLSHYALIARNYGRCIVLDSAEVTPDIDAFNLTKESDND